MGVALGLGVPAALAAVVAVLAAARRGPAGIGPARPAAVAVLLAATAVLVAVESATGTLPGVDRPVLDAVVAARTGPATTIAEVLSLAGGTVSTATAGVLAALVLARTGRPRWAVVWVAAVVLGALLIRFLKLAVERPRPPVATRLAVETTTSLPSGHALMAALGLGLVAAAALAPHRLGSRPRSRALGRGVAVVAVVLALAIGSSRVYLGVHWAGDVLAGWLLGAALVLVARTVAAVVDPDRPPRTVESTVTQSDDPRDTGASG